MLLVFFFCFFYTKLIIKYFLIFEGKHRGFAFIEFQSREDAEAAIDNMVFKISIYNN
jgi:RNA recognition motif-containing protein